MTGDQESWARHRKVWRLAIPIILANLSVPLLGAVDTAVLGHLPHPRFLGGVALANSMFLFIFWGFGFLRMGTTGLAAQAMGSDDGGETRAVLARALLLALFFGLILWLLQSPLLALALELFQASPESESEAGIYFHIRIWSAPAALANYCLLGWFIGVQNMRAALILQVLMNGINIALDLLFVVGLGMETAGVAAATAIAEVMAVAAGLVLVLKELTHMRGRLTRSAIFDRARIMRMLTLNRDIFIRTFLLIFAFVLFTAEGAKFGDGTLAANAVLLQFQFFLAFGLDGFAHSAEALVGNALGAGDRKELAAWVRVTGLWALVVALLYVIFYLLAGNLIIDLLTGLEGVREEARQFLPWVIASPFLSVWSYMLDGIFIGATRSREMRNAMIASVAIYGASLYLAQPVLGNHGLWLSLMVLMLARAATLLAYYPRISREI